MGSVKLAVGDIGAVEHRGRWGGFGQLVEAVIAVTSLGRFELENEMVMVLLPRLFAAPLYGVRVISDSNSGPMGVWVLATSSTRWASSAGDTCRGSLHARCRYREEEISLPGGSFNWRNGVDWMTAPRLSAAQCQGRLAPGFALNDVPLLVVVKLRSAAVSQAGDSAAYARQMAPPACPNLVDVAQTSPDAAIDWATSGGL